MSETLRDVVDRLAFGVVPIPHEPMRFEVLSKSRAGWKYTVDKSEFPPNGSCTCDAFLKFGLHGRLERGDKVGPATRCEHIKRVDRYIEIVTTVHFVKLVAMGKGEAVECLLTVDDGETVEAVVPANEEAPAW